MSFKTASGKNIVTGDFSKLENMLSKLSKKIYVDVGILGSEVNPETGITIAGIGAVHEFGTDKAGRGKSTTIPERSFLRMPIETKSDDIEAFASKGLDKNLADGNIRRIFEQVGKGAEAVIQDAFETGGFGTWPELAQSTIDAKGSSGILIDTGLLRKSITSKVGE